MRFRHAFPAALLLVSCDVSTPGDPVLVPVLRPAWTFQHRWPTSSDLRSVRFLSPTTGYIAGEATTILLTQNGGASWTQLEHTPESRGGDIAAMDAFGSGVVLTVGAEPSGGRWWSTVDGVNFQTPDVPSTGYGAFTAVDVTSLTTSYALTSSGSIRFRNGNQESMLSVGAAGQWYAIDFFGTSGTGFVAGSGGKIRKTTDNGASWTDLPSATASTLRALWFPGTIIGFACGDGGTVVKTMDATTWSDISPGGGVTLRAIHFPVDINTGWVVGDGPTILKTVNGGLTWAPQFPGGIADDLYGVWFADLMTGYAVGNNGAVIRTVDGGATWVDITLGTRPQLNAVDFTADGIRGVAVGNGGVILTTTDAGVHWVPSASGVAWDLLSVSVPPTGSGNVAYACGGSGTVLKTTNFGANWTPSNPTAQTLRAIHFPGSDTFGFCAGDAGTVLKTNDGGATWTPQAAPAADYHSIAVSGGGLTVYAGGTSGMVGYSATGGAFWEARPLPVSTTIHSIRSPSPSTAFAGTQDGKVYRTFLSATLWQATSPGLVPLGVAFTGTSNGWTVGAEGIFLTSDGGLNWGRSYEHTNHVLRGVWMNLQGIGYAVGDGGTILRTTSGGY